MSVGIEHGPLFNQLFLLRACTALCADAGAFANCHDCRSSGYLSSPAWPTGSRAVSSLSWTQHWRKRSCKGAAQHIKVPGAHRRIANPAVRRKLQLPICASVGRACAAAQQRQLESGSIPQRQSPAICAQHGGLAAFRAIISTKGAVRCLNVAEEATTVGTVPSAVRSIALYLYQPQQ